MNKLYLTLLVLLSLFPVLHAKDSPSIYSFTVKGIEGNDVNMEEYRGKVLLIVNVASKCGYTYQYEGLEKLYREYSDRGLVVLGFPSNDFLWQEPGSDEDILEFCTSSFDVTFPLFSKIKVTGKNMEPLYSYLTSTETDPDFSGRILWNFNKFLIDREGNMVDRFDSKTEPYDREVLDALEKTLNRM